MKVGILGYGVVGKQVAAFIEDEKTFRKYGLEVEKILVRQGKEDQQKKTSRLADITENHDIQVVVECMGGLHPAYEYVKDALIHSKDVVTSNKKMLAVYGKELLQLAQKNGVSLCYEACVGGGIPWITSLNRIKRLEDIHSFAGILNGTTNYILSGMSLKNLEFSELLEQAQKAGYAESDPSDDIYGYDVQSKVALTCCAAFDTWIHVDDIPVYGVAGILKKDMEYAHRVGGEIRLVGKANQIGNGIEAYVMPQLIGTNHLLACVNSNQNGLMCESDALGTSFFLGQGAGGDPTANAVVQDILDCLENKQEEVVLKDGIIDLSNKRGVYYIRCEKPEVLEGYTQEKIDENTVITSFISFELVQKLYQDSHATFIMEVEDND